MYEFVPGIKFCRTAFFLICIQACLLSMVAGQGSLKKAVTPKPSVARSPLDTWVDGVIARVKQQRDAKVALEMLDELLQAPELNDAQKKKLTLEQAKFKGYADQGLVRNGQSWITVEEESRRITQADQLIERGVTFVRLSDDKSAKEAFEEASKTDLNGVRADFILGMMNSPLVAFAPKVAEDHFKEILRRSPSHPSAMNNLALCLVRQGEFAEALRIWKELDRQDPGSELVLYNITKLVHDIRDGRLVPLKPVAKTIEKFYVDLVSGTVSDSKIEPIGWRYANLTLARNEEDRTRFDESSILVGSDTVSGFVVQNGYVVTALHCVRDYNKMSVVFSTGKEVEASLESASELYNVAVLKIPGSGVPAAATKVITPDKKSKLYHLAFSSEQLGTSVVEPHELTLSSISPPPGAGCFVCDSRRQQRYAGGPVCDASGNVVGMVTSISALDSGLTPVVSISHVLAHVKRRCPEFEGAQPSKIVFDDAQKIVARTGGSVCQIMVSKKYHSFGVGRSGDPRYVLDTKESCCGGARSINCPAKGCNNGQISVRKKAVLSENPLAGKIMGLKVVGQNCPRCNGTGKIPCPFTH